MYQRKPSETAVEDGAIITDAEKTAFLTARENARKRRTMTINNSTHRTQCNSTPQAVFLCLGIVIGIWGFVGTWMAIIYTMEPIALERNHSQLLRNQLEHQTTRTATVFQQFSENAPECSPLESPESITITLVTQVSHDRLWMMKHHCERYRTKDKQHSMSIAVYSNSTLEEILDELTGLGCGIDRNDGNTGVKVTLLDAKTHGAWNDYPVNELRNLALSRVQTTHILYLDVDFWPSDNLFETLMGDTVRSALWKDPMQAVVLPAFQLWRQCREWKDCRDNNLPRMDRSRTPDGLELELFKKKSITVFDPTNRGGHGSTNYPEWFRQPAGSLEPILCIQSNRYEPFVVVRYCQDLPPFQPAFAGYGKNKVTWTMNLVAKGYVFGQVGGAYLVHYPHLDSASRQHWNEKYSTDEEEHPVDAKRSQVDRLFVDFRDWLRDTIPVSERRLHLCEDAQDDDGKLWVEHASKKPKDGDGNP